jgi:type II secretory ATPase GspE/PulE/Tfp pilus assembly ATPase PilB-like protein
MISEILTINDTISRVIAENGSKTMIADLAIENNLYTPMIHDGLQKALKGITTLEEVLRVVKDK